MILRLKKQHYTLLREEARKTLPIEACALLFGKLSEKEATAEKIVVTPNVLGSSVRFEIDSKAFYDAFTNASKEGHEFIGFFHSHPASAEPSSIDLQFMRLWGDVVWLIFSLTNEKFAAFQMRNNKIEVLTLKIEGKLKE